ncbi:MAG: amidohydrolase family protein [Planctomycetota bacterium]
MQSRTTRRDFLKQTAVAGAGMWAAGQVLDFSLTTTANAKGLNVNHLASLPIVDTHQHLWDLTKFELPWTKGADAKSLAKNFLPSDYKAAIEGSNVVKSVYMEVDVLPSQQSKEADYVIDICQRGETPMVAAVISGRPNSDEFKAYITKYAGSKYIKGVRQVLHSDVTPAGYCVDPKFVQGIKLLGDLGLSFDLCMRAGELADAVKLVDQCPKTRFIVDHCGNMNVQSTDEELRTKWKKGMHDLAQRPNVVCKISGMIASAKPATWKNEDLAPILNYSMDTFGPDRIMFGGDWPVCTLAASYKQWVEALKAVTASKSEEDRRKLFHDNAVKFYGLS